MRANVALLLALVAPVLQAAVSQTNWPDAAVMKFVFVENNADDNFFVTPAGGLDPRMTGANKWTGLKYGGSGTVYQQSLGYVDNGYNTGLNANWRYDMWLENAPIKNPFLGLRCINWYAGCNMDTSLILPQTTDEKGFYGTVVTPGGAKWMHGMMSPSFYQYLKQMAAGEAFSMQINGCQTSVAYDAAAGGRCRDQPAAAGTSAPSRTARRPTCALSIPTPYRRCSSTAMGCRSSARAMPIARTRPSAPAQASCARWSATICRPTAA